MQHHSWTRRQIRVALLTSLLASHSVPHAEVEEILVTASRRAESAQSVGASLSTLSADDYRESGASDLGRLADQIPNVNVFANNSTLQALYIRGIGQNEFAGNLDGPTATYVDEVYISKPWMISRPQFDVERVEVLKGPQGTLFGRNTTAGALSYYTKSPERERSAAVDASADHHQRYQLSGFGNTPLTARLSARLSYSLAANNGGPWHNRTLNDDQGGREHPLGRLKLLWEGDEATLLLSLHGGADRSEMVAYTSPGLFDAGGGLCPAIFSGAIIADPSACLKFAGAAAALGVPTAERDDGKQSTVSSGIVNARDDRFGGVQLRIERFFERAVLTSISAYEGYRSNWHDNPDDTPFVGVDTTYFDDIDQFTQELRLTGKRGERLRYVAGLFFEHTDLVEINNGDLSRNPLGILPPQFPVLASELSQEVNAVAVFMNAEFDLLPTVAFIGGIRGTYETTEVNARTSLSRSDRRGRADRVTPVLITTFDGGGQLLAQAPNAGFLRDTLRQDDLSWRAGLEWQMHDDIMLYGTLATGYRTGGFASPIGGEVKKFDAEEILSREVGVKAWLLDRQLQANASGFYYTYDDVQVNVDDPTAGLAPFTQNIGEQEGVGGEVDLWWSPNVAWDVRLGGSYLDAEFSKTSAAISDYTTQITGRPTPLQGKRPVNAPPWSLNGAVRHQRALGHGLLMLLGAQARWVDERFLEVTNQAFDRAPSYAALNLRAAIKTVDDKWEFALWGNNVTDAEILTYINNIQWFTVHVYSEPATWGLSVRYEMD